MLARVLSIALLAQLIFGEVGAQVKRPVLKERLALSMELFDGADGLSQGLVTSLEEDTNGYLWLGTMDGLNRFDGLNFKVFRHNGSDSTSIPDNYVKNVVLDSKGRLWVSTRNGGICYYNPATENFTRFKGNTVDESYSGLGAVGMMNTLPDGGAMVWSMKSGKMECFVHDDNRSEGEIIPYRPSWVERLQAETSPKLPEDKSFLRFQFDARGNFWLDRTDSVFLCSGPRNDMKMRSFVNEVKNSRKMVWADLFSDPRQENMYWLKNRERRMLWKYNYHLADFEPFMELPEACASLSSKLVDGRQRLWAWTAGGNIVMVDLNNAKYTEFEVEWPLSIERSGLGGRWFEDSNGNLWFGTDGYGLLKISATVQKFKRMSKQVEAKYDYVQTFRVVKQGEHALFDPKVRSKWNEVKDRLLPFMKDEGLGFNMQFLTVDNRGDLLVSVHSEQKKISHILRVDTATFSRSVIASKPLTRSYWGYPILLDAKNYMWCTERPGPNGQNLYRYDLNTGSEDVFDVPFEFEPLDIDFLADWHEDSLNRKLWLGTSYGLFCFDAKNSTWSAYFNHEGDEGSLSSNLVLSVLPDPDNPTGVLWVGTEGGGLNRLDISTGKFSHYTTENSDLPNNVVIGMLADKHGNLWMSTNNGFCRFEPRSGTFLNFFRQDGLTDNEFSTSDYSMSREGELYFGGVSGWIHFNPEEFYESAPASKLVFTGLKLWNKPVLEIGEDAILKKPLAAGDEITLSYENNMVTIDFALLDLTAPLRNRYKYQMDGLSDNWVELGNATEATFTSLDPGSYTFRVLGCNSSGVWTTEPTELSITILPPWYATWWFKSLMAFVLASSLYGFYRYRLAQLLRMERMRNRIAQDLHDEIGSTISSISLFGSVLKNTMRKDPDKADRILDRITTYSSQIGERMNDMVWTIKADNDSFAEVVNRMRAFGVAMTESKGIALRFQVDSKVERLNLGMDIRKNVYLIYKEAVNNAVKYSKCTELTVTLEQCGKELHMWVSDNGIGFNAEAVAAETGSMGGNGLKGMKMRAKEMKADLHLEMQPHGGTDIRLKVTL